MLWVIFMGLALVLVPIILVPEEYFSIAWWFPLMIAFLLLSGWRITIGCAACGVSVFQQKLGGMDYFMPWPAKICGKCGYDLTQTENSTSSSLTGEIDKEAMISADDV
ncbi:MAG: hypothetical protein ABJX46_01355 [Erythrobacter sp.]